MNLRQALLRRLTRFQRDSRGTSAVEFAIIAPLLLVILVPLADVTNIAYGTSHMQGAVRAGIHYAMAGGTDETVARSQADSAWTKKPDDAVVTASKVCKCVGITTDCAILCPDFTRPEMYISVSATGTFGGNVYSMTQTSTETVRVR